MLADVAARLAVTYAFARQAALCPGAMAQACQNAAHTTVPTDCWDARERCQIPRRSIERSRCAIAPPPWRIRAASGHPAWRHPAENQDQAREGEKQLNFFASCYQPWTQRPPQFSSKNR